MHFLHLLANYTSLLIDNRDIYARRNTKLAALDHGES
jgi:hypothetical protein